MNPFSFLIVFLMTVPSLFPQSKILLTYLDYNSREARVAMWDKQNEKLIDLGFNKTYHPSAIGKSVLFNGDSFVWKCDEDGGRLRKVIYGYKVSVSNRQDKFACYTESGIAIVDSADKILKRVEVDPWTDISITWGENDECIYFYELVRQTCYLYNLENDSVAIFGKYIYQPVWRNGWVLFNKLSADGKYSVFLGRTPVDAAKISSDREMALVPVFSRSGKYVAYISVVPDSLQPGNTDMFIGTLCLYDIAKSTTIELSREAGFSDQVYPQLAFSHDDTELLFTAVGKNGNGEIRSVSIKTHNTVLRIGDAEKDYRYPVWAGNAK